jgi:hypothetical protein
LSTALQTRYPRTSVDFELEIQQFVQRQFDLLVVKVDLGYQLVVAGDGAPAQIDSISNSHGCAGSDGEDVPSAIVDDIATWRFSFHREGA